MLATLGLLSQSGCGEAPDADPTSQRNVERAFADVPRDQGWPRLFGPTRNSISGEQQIRTEWSGGGPPIQWRATAGTGYSSPVVAQGRIVLLHRFDAEERVDCWDAETGAVIWSYSYPTTYDCEYAHSEGPYSTPVIDGQRVYTLGAQGQLHCLDLAAGKLIWRRLLHEEYEPPERKWPHAGSPWIDGDLLILNLGSPLAGILGIDKQTGASRWSVDDEPAGCATPVTAVIHGLRHAFVFTNKSLVSLDPETGKIRWRVSHFCRAPDSDNSTSPLVSGDLVLAVTGPGPGAICLRILPDGGYEEKWRDRRVLDSQFNTLIHVGDHVYGFSSTRQDGATLRCVELATGKLQWQWASDLARGQGLAVDGRLILWGERGHLASVEVNSAEAQPVSMTQEPLLEGPCYSAPALHRGLLYLRNEQQLLCLNLRKGPPAEIEESLSSRKNGPANKALSVLTPDRLSSE